MELNNDTLMFKKVREVIQVREFMQFYIQKSTFHLQFRHFLITYRTVARFIEIFQIFIFIAVSNVKFKIPVCRPAFKYIYFKYIYFKYI